MIELDAADRRILAVLQAQGRISNQDLSEKINLSPSACHRRVARLEEEGVITGYAALMDPRHAGRSTTVFVQVTLERQSEEAMRAFEAAVAELPDIMECHLMSGGSDYMIRVAVRDLNDYERVHTGYLAKMPGVARIHSSFALRTVKKVTAYDINDRDET